MRIGVVINPVTGMGGRISLRGTDGKVTEVRARDAEPRSPERIRRTLSRLFETTPEAGLLAWGDEMGVATARDTGFDPEMLDEPPSDKTSAVGTAATAGAFVDADADLVSFIGGGGIAADVAGALDGTDVPMLGAPAGVKVCSSVFIVSPEDAAHIVTSFERTEAREIMDIDEDDYRDGEIRPELRAVAHISVAEDLQSSRQTGGGTARPFAADVADNIRSTEGVTYILGPGSTIGAVKVELGIDGSPLSADIYRDDEVLARDAMEAEILANLGAENVIVVTPIDG